MKCPKCDGTGSVGEKPPELRPRELEALKLLAENLSPSWVAEQMFVRPNTIHQYAVRIRAFFGVTSNEAAVAKARQWDVI